MKARKSNPKKRDPEEMIRDGLGLIRSVYYKKVAELAQGVVDDNEKDMDRESFMDMIHEVVDGYEWVIYTNKAQIVVLVSDNEAAAFDEGLVDPSSWKEGIAWSQLAYAALERDLYEALEQIGVDPNADQPLAEAKRSRSRSR